ncbi:CGNR zinc finger domain-containing protein [Salinispora oceanensis]|uniref:CGNR zinc finger domain-containing protein n=1 Tax=Salinispora oceanensis TaxID=1050199 RepID=UPI00035F6005|nr:CGNR zinc finger domain-containing protein [Salinispora oceanensis]
MSDTGLPRDPRPLIGEPLGLDLLNTIWVDAEGPHDLLGDLVGTRLWLASNDRSHWPATEPVRQALLVAREAIRAHLTDPASPAALAALNSVLAWGHVTRSVGQDGPTTVVRVEDPVHLAAWHAADNYHTLLTERADRLRRCAHPDCVLHFLDTSPKGNRRWCSMAGCGNRAKAARHYARSRHAAN